MSIASRTAGDLWHSPVVVGGENDVVTGVGASSIYRARLEGDSRSCGYPANRQNLDTVCRYLLEEDVRTPAGDVDVDGLTQVVGESQTNVSGGLRTGCDLHLSVNAAGSRNSSHQGKGREKDPHHASIEIDFQDV